MASKQAAQARDEILAALERDLEAARYAARRAEKQYQSADPENRLVAQELERRWNQSLQHVQTLERRLEQQRAGQSDHGDPTRGELAHLTADLEAVWNDPHSDARRKKRIVRTLIHEVVADIDSAAGEIILVIHWKGGVHTELHLPRRRRGQCTATAKNIVQAVRLLANICSDDAIAGILNRNGLQTGRNNRWTRQRVITLRSGNRIPRYDPETRKSAGWMTLTDAAKFLGISTRTLRLAVEHGQLAGKHPLPDGPWLLQRAVLETEAASRIVQSARQHSRTPAKPNGNQGSLDLFSDSRGGVV